MAGALQSLGRIMTYTETCDNFAALAGHKVEGLKRAPLGFVMGTLLAGAYIGVAYVLALTVSAGLPAGVRPLTLGAVFGIGLILVVMAGAELFTGHVMYMTFGLAKRTVTPVDAITVLVTVWIGNLIGSVILATLFAKGGGGAVFAAPAAYLHDFIAKKQGSTVLALVCRATLCNWLVCLAIWLPSRLASDSAKIIGMAWCLLAFVACGFEHSVANMTIFSLGFLAPVQAGTLYGAAYNLLWVTIGNLIGGGLLVAGAYLLASTTDPHAPHLAANPAASDRVRPAQRTTS
jgi:nitrite transporter